MKVVLAVFAGVLVLGGAAWAAEEKPRRPAEDKGDKGRRSAEDKGRRPADTDRRPAGDERRDPFNEFDRDGDGALAGDEISAMVRQITERMDANSDGRITREEFQSARERTSGDGRRRPDAPGPRPGGPGEGTFFERFDRNQDGKITKDEIPERMPQPLRDLLAQADTNGDGAVSKEEAQAVRTKIEGLLGGQPGPGPEQLLKEFDKNADGKLGRDEVPERLAQVFDRLDENRDGSLGADELAAAQQRLPGFGGGPPDGAALLGRFDKDGDGKLSREEAPEFLQRGFDRIDADGDGKVGKDELGKAFEAMRGRIGAPDGPGGPPSPRRLFNQQDADADGRVTREEAKGVLGERFDQLDANKDGKLDALEVENGLAKDQ